MEYPKPGTLLPEHEVEDTSHNEELGSNRPSMEVDEEGKEDVPAVSSMGDRGSVDAEVCVRDQQPKMKWSQLHCYDVDVLFRTGLVKK